MLISIKGNWDNAQKEHNDYLNKIITDYGNNKTFVKSSDKTVQQCLGIKLEKLHSDTKKFINKVKPLILSSEVSKLRESIVFFDKYKKHLASLHTDNYVEVFILELKKIFNYDNFVKKNVDIKVWNAYSLCRLSKIRTCPYCNMAYSFTLQKKGRGFRPTLDHFYCKNKYPHLALALNNLIPSCSSCNSSLKATKNFYDTPHLNPLEHAENIRFKLVASGNPALTMGSILFNRKDIKILAEAVSDNIETQNTLKTFMINDRYDFVLQEALEFVSAKIFYSEYLTSGLESLNINEKVVLRFDKDSYKNYPLGRLFLDLYNTFEYR